MRRPKPAAREPAAIGCDLGGTRIKVVALAGERIVSAIDAPTPQSGPAARIVSAILAALRRARKPELRVRGLGIALPGFLDAGRATPLRIANLPALEGCPLKSILRRRTGLPVLLEPDSNAGAYGEARLGAGRAASRLLYLTLGTGVGAAMVAEGKIVRVANHTVGQVAHFPLERDGPRCPCGQRGCVESVLSARGIAWRAARASPGLPAQARRTPAGLSEAAAAGSKTAKKVLGEVGALLGRTLAFLANFLSPDAIVVGGGIARAGEPLLAPAREAFFERAHPLLRGRVTIAAAELGPFAGAIGAALLAKDAAG